MTARRSHYHVIPSWSLVAGIYTPLPATFDYCVQCAIMFSYLKCQIEDRRCAPQAALTFVRRADRIGQQIDPSARFNAADMQVGAPKGGLNETDEA